ncbi:hypothetical protein BDN72DRAFT_798009 [Pluteus cervinus]|uniref:Uncharacterized protein n=1 Tax=Pluteus cervinus TaxID=181527 RepID=A0ACD3AR17_9AGAR|nr:hypothetical protein BDN72DRAFT_798009 [Pluteus cervinus]
MPRPAPLSSTSARPNATDYQLLTPRTPHSRTGRAEEAFTDVELDDFTNNSNANNDYEHDDRYLNPRAPLLGGRDGRLAATSSASSGYRSRGDDYDASSKKDKLFEGLTVPMVMGRLPLVLGTMAAGFLLVLVFLSVKKPETLQQLVGVQSASATVEAAVATATEALDASSDSKPQGQQQQQVELTPPPSHPSSNTISYSNYTQFPLLPDQYRDECAKLMHGYMSHGDYWNPPLHTNGEIPDVEHHDVKPDSTYSLPEGGVNTVCKSTITYMLDGKVGLLADLALMAQVAALARERNRTFFIDDTYWNRGKWTDHFQPVQAGQPGPEPGCRAPPPEELVACPRLARHWVVNSRTVRYHLGHGFQNHYQDAYGRFLNRLRPIFDAGAASFTETIRPNALTAALIRAARQELKRVIEQKQRQLFSSIGLENTSEEDPDAILPYVSVHVRRGDRKPKSYSFLGEKIPTKIYTDALTTVWNRIVDEKYPTIGTSDKEALQSSIVVYFASDSPEALGEFREPFLVAESESSAPPDQKKTPMVFSLWESNNPELRVLGSRGDYHQREFDELDEGARVRATRGMIVDFAMINGFWSWPGEVKPQAVVCAISSNICRVSAMGLGWDIAFGGVNTMGDWNNTGRGWIDVDLNGRVIPSWEAFELF